MIDWSVVNTYWLVFFCGLAFGAVTCLMWQAFDSAAIVERLIARIRRWWRK